jgi:hypothetical protein
MSERDEARRLIHALDSSVREVLALLSNQLGVLKSQAQALIGLSGLCITVTGFSGHNMVRAGLFSTVTMCAGIALILVGTILSLRVLGRVRWVTQDLVESLEDAATAVIERRNGQQRALLRAGYAVAIGLAFYVVAVMVAALSGSPWSPP